MRLRIRRRDVAHAQFGPAIHPVLGRVYAARGIRAAEELDCALERLIPVGTLDGVEAAAQLLARHRERGRVLIVGDFDTDGATSTALMIRALRAWSFSSVDYLVPNRFEFGYGLTPQIVELAAERRPTLIVTVDNGMSSIAGVAAARERGIDVLVTDHHLPGVEWPSANVIVNPNAGTSGFASRALAGVGVAFYVAAALRRRLEGTGEIARDAPGAAQLLDLVALGTVADLVPLDANNRVLVAQGLRRIRAGRAVPGIRALLDIARRRSQELTAADLAFAVAPRLNAAGRLDDMSIGIQCLTAEDCDLAARLAARLDALNQERRAIEARMQAEALDAVRGLIERASDDGRHGGLTLFDESWHQGVVGLVAGRVKERTRRPVIAFAQAGDGSLRGSARSVAGLHIRDVLAQIDAREPGLISRFGGHAMAAGLTLERMQLERFARAFEEEVARSLDGLADRDAIETDGELEVHEIALDTATALRGGGPWGQAFPEPCFDGLFRVRSSRVVGDRHLKMWIEAARGGRTFDAIAFNFFDVSANADRLRADRAELPQGEARLVYRLDINDYQGERRLQLLVDHVLPASGSL